MKYIAMICLLALAGCSNEPSCEERGGREVLTGYYNGFILVGKVMVPQVFPMYACALPGETLE